MGTMEWLMVGVTTLLGFYMAWTIGANDVANSMADAVGSRAISIKKAILAAGICEFLGAVLVGSHVANTIRKGIIAPDAMASEPYALALGMACALLGAAIWLHIATWWGMPVSTTHSIVGAVAGIGVVAVGIHAINMDKMGQIVASWFISPVAGGIMAYFSFRLIVWTILGSPTPARSAVRFAPFIIFFVAVVMALAILYKGLKHVLGEFVWLSEHAIPVSIVFGIVSAIGSRFWLRHFLEKFYEVPHADQLERVERVFAPIVVITSCCVAFSHGANDVANAIGPLSAVIDIVRTGTVTSKVPVSLWVLCLGGAGIVVGLATYGYRVMHTVGDKITQLTPTRGVAADVAATTMVLVCSRLGLPVSTTHTLVGAIMGVGLARGLSSVNRKVTLDIFGGWLITVPAAGFVAVFLFVVARWMFL